MAVKQYRTNTLLPANATESTKPDFGIGYTITAYEVGGQVATATSGTSVTVRDGHGFVANDKLLLETNSGIALTSYRTVQSVSGNVLTLNSALTVAVGNILCNLGPDTGAVTPNYDGSGATSYSDMEGAASNTNEAVTSDATGGYEYWHDGTIGIWELVRDALGDPVAVIQWAFDGAAENFGIRYAHQYASAGDGSASDPWTGWESILAANSRIHFRPGYFKTITGLSLTAHPGVMFSGDGMDCTFLICAADVNLIEINNTAEVNTGVSIRDMTLMQHDVALTAGKALVKASWAPNLQMSNVTFRNNGNFTANAAAVLTREVNQADFDNIHVVGTSGRTWGVGLDLCNDCQQNRGNHTVSEGTLSRCTIGIRIAESANQLVNNILIDNVKMVSVGTYGVLVPSATGVRNISMENLHVEGIAVTGGEPNGSITACVHLSAVSGFRIHGGHFSAFIGTAISVNAICSRFSILDNNIVNGASSSPYNATNGITLDASAHTDLRIGRNRFTNIVTKLTNNSTTDSQTFIELGVNDGGGGFLFDGAVDITGTLHATGAVDFDAQVDCNINLLVGGAFNLKPPSTVTIAAGAVTVTRANHQVESEDASPDTLSTISGGAEGNLLILRCVSSARAITLDQNGNITVPGATFVLSDPADVAFLYKTSGNWLMISGSDNT